MPTITKINRGFTLIEFLISITIVSVILTVVVSNQSTYNDEAVLVNLADKISSTVSQAQAYGTGVREFSPASGEFGASYGLTFSLLVSGSNVAYLSFADRNGNKVYDGNWLCPTGGTSECLEKNDISRGNYIEGICVVRTSGPDLCFASRVDISFARPSTEAQLLFFDYLGGPLAPWFLSNMKGVRIVLRSPNGLTRSVVVYTTGQVSVQTAGLTLTS